MSENIKIPQELLGAPCDNHISNDEASMLTAFTWAARSKDPNTQVGACFVNEKGRVISMGYNGTPVGWDDEKFPWRRPETKEEGQINSKYPYVIHAEINGILNYDGPGKDFIGSTCFVTLFPCSNCAKMLAQRGIKRIVYYTDDRQDTEDNKCAKLLFRELGIEYIQFNELKTRRTEDVQISLGDTQAPIKMKRKDEIKRI